MTKEKAIKEEVVIPWRPQCSCCKKPMNVIIEQPGFTLNRTRMLDAEQAQIVVEVDYRCQFSFRQETFSIPAIIYQGIKDAYIIKNKDLYKNIRRRS